jgi:septum formation protein
MLTLASASPRRRELLALICPSFDVVPSAIEEQLDPGDVRRAIPALALRKALSVVPVARRGVVLGADTVVLVDGAALGKPADAADARRMLTELRGRVHTVITGVALVDVASARETTTAVESRVVMGRYSDAVIEEYVASGEPLDKAGAYGVQGRGAELVVAVVGSYTNVIGLPLAATRRLLTEFGVAQTSATRPGGRAFA